MGHKLEAPGVTRIRVLGPYNLPGTATAAKEKVLSSVRHIPGTGGRVDVRAWGGDIAADTYYVGSACWDAQEKELYRVLAPVLGLGPPGELHGGARQPRGQLPGLPRGGPARRRDARRRAPGDAATPEPGNPGAPDDVPGRRDRRLLFLNAARIPYEAPGAAPRSPAL